MVKIVIQKKIGDFDKTISVDGDKSISIRALLIGSQSYGICKIKNLSKSGDILSTINGLKKLGIKIFFKNNICFLKGNGLNGFDYKKNIVIDAGNSGTFARLLLGLLIRSPHTIKIKGDKSLSRRDFQRIIGKESRKQILKTEGRLPDHVIACVGGGSNAIGMFYDFIKDKDVKIIAVEAAGEGVAGGGAPQGDPVDA